MDITFFFIPAALIVTIVFMAVRTLWRSISHSPASITTPTAALPGSSKLKLFVDLVKPTVNSNLVPSTYFRLPNLIPGPEWEFRCPPHPLQEQATKEGLNWVRSLGIYDEKVLNRFAKYRIDVLVAWVYRHASPKHYRCCMDFMYMYWIVDDCIDNQTPEEAANEVKHILQALK